MIYRIEWLDNGQSRAIVTRKRIDCAIPQIYKMARDIVASWAMLDTKRGWQFMREVMALELKPGLSHSVQLASNRPDIIKVSVAA